MTIPPPNPDTCTYIGQVVQYNTGEQIIDVTCTLEGTLYGYLPDVGANSFFTAFFGICFFWQLFCGIKYKTWTFMIALCLGCIGEAVGYGGRLMLYVDTFDDNAFIIQICCLIISPAFVSAGVYLTLKHIVISFGEGWSRLKPVWYTRIFITGDIFSLILQGAGGGLASTADDGSSLQDVGTNLMIAGVIFQVVILAFFGYFLTEYTIRTYRRRDQLTAESMALFRTKRFRTFMGAVVLAFLCIFVRCVYRIPELTGGWRSELMRNEDEFIILEGVMLIVAVGVLTVFHPGYCFPVLGNTIGKNKTPRGKSFEDSDIEMMGGR